MIKQFMDKQSQHTITAIFWSVLVFVFLAYLFSLILPDVTSCKVTVEIDHDDFFQLYYQNEDNFNETYSLKSTNLKANKKTTIFFALHGLPIERLRLDPGNDLGVIKIYSIVIHSNFVKPVVYGVEELYGILAPGTDDITIQKESNYLKIISETDDPYIVANRPLYKNNIALLYGLPFIVAVIVFSRLSRHKRFSVPVFYEKTIKDVIPTTPVKSLNGLRGIAIIMVVGEHTCGYLAGLGTGGVWIFMALSGFLLAKPYTKTSNLAISWSHITRYFWRRLQRIVPIYYTYICVLYLLNLQFEQAIRHFLFLQGDGHLWFIPQLMLFYLFFPVIMALNHIVFRGRSLLILAFLLAAVIGSNMYFTREVFSFYGMNSIHYRFFLGIFLSGVFFSYLYYGIYESSSLPEKWQNYIEKVCSGLAIIIFLLFLLCFSEKLWGGGNILTRGHFSWFGFAAGLLIFCLVVAQKSLLNRFLSWNFLQAFSLVSFSLYLVHTLILRILISGAAYFVEGYVLSGLSLFVSTLLVGYYIAKYLYSHIEKPA